MLCGQVDPDTEKFCAVIMFDPAHQILGNLDLGRKKQVQFLFDFPPQEHGKDICRFERSAGRGVISSDAHTVF